MPGAVPYAAETWLAALASRETCGMNSCGDGDAGVPGEVEAWRARAASRLPRYRGGYTGGDAMMDRTYAFFGGVWWAGEGHAALLQTWFGMVQRYGRVLFHGSFGGRGRASVINPFNLCHRSGSWVTPASRFCGQASRPVELVLACMMDAITGKFPSMQDASHWKACGQSSTTTDSRPSVHTVARCRLRAGSRQ